MHSKRYPKYVAVLTPSAHPASGQLRLVTEAGSLTRAWPTVMRESRVQLLQDSVLSLRMSVHHMMPELLAEPEHEPSHPG